MVSLHYLIQLRRYLQNWNIISPSLFPCLVYKVVHSVVILLVSSFQKTWTLVHNVVTMCFSTTGVAVFAIFRYYLPPLPKTRRSVVLNNVVVSFMFHIQYTEGWCWLLCFFTFQYFWRFLLITTMLHDLSSLSNKLKDCYFQNCATLYISYQCFKSVFGCNIICLIFPIHLKTVTAYNVGVLFVSCSPITRKLYLFTRTD